MILMASLAPYRWTKVCRICFANTKSSTEGRGSIIRYSFAAGFHAVFSGAGACM